MGAAQEEVQVLGFHPKERVSRFEEAVQIVRRLLNEAPVSHNGPHHRFEDFTLEPRPVQRPMPVWIANEPNLEKPELAERQCRRVASLADGWMTDGGPTPAVFAARWQLLSRHLRDAGRDTALFPTAYHMMINIHDDRRRAWDDGVRFLTRYYGPMRDEFLRIWLAAGPAEEVATRIQAYVDAGCRLPILRFAAWDAPLQIRRFLDHVYPRLKTAPAKPA